jgi:hypothetical protein
MKQFTALSRFWLNGEKVSEKATLDEKDFKGPDQISYLTSIGLIAEKAIKATKDRSIGLPTSDEGADLP